MDEIHPVYMRFSIFFPALLCFAVLLPLQPAFCQTPTVAPVAVDARQSRHVIVLPSPQPTLRIHNLLPGKQYTLFLPNDEHGNGCAPTANALALGTQQGAFDLATRSLKFTPSASLLDFQLDYSCDWDSNHPPTCFVSVVCESCARKTLQDVQQDMGALTVAKGFPAEELVRNVLVGGDCFDLANVTFSGHPEQIGTFSNGSTTIGFNNGIIMATGDISVATGPNTVDNADIGYDDATPDTDLATLTTGATYDMADLEFDFVPTRTPVSFEFVFASEEYCEYVNSPFNDVFGFFISGPGIIGNGNIALLPFAGDPVAINNVNYLTNPEFFINNTPGNGNLCDQLPAESMAVEEIQFDGFTTGMVATANVVPCQTYHIKLKIADVNDGIFNSAVFLKANSFYAGGNTAVSFVVNNSPTDDQAYEGCGTAQLVFDRVGASPDADLSVQYTISGTATSGLDYIPIPASVVIPAGQDKLTLPITILTDALSEGQETFIITLSNPCSCVRPQQTLYLRDLPGLQLTGDTIAVCGSGIGTVGVTTSNGVGPFTYAWSNGTTNASLSISAGVSTNYKVTVTDACGKSNVATARIEVRPLPLAQLLLPAPQLCPGQESQLFVNFTGTGPYDLQYTLNNIQQPPIAGITSNPYALIINQSGLYQVSSVTDGVGCVGPGQGSLLLLPSSLQLTGLAHPVRCTGQANGSIATIVTGGQAPYTYAWTGPQTVPASASPTNLMAGQYTVTVADGAGCTKTQIFLVSDLTPLTPNVANVIPPNCYNANGGSIALAIAGGVPNYSYQWSNGSLLQSPQNLSIGTYTVTVTDGAGCTKTASITLAGNFTPPLANATAPGTLSCSHTSLQLDGTGSSTGTGHTYQWTTVATGNIVSMATTLMPTVNQVGTYKLVVTNTTNGCTAAASVQVSSSVAYPTANAGPDQVLTCAITNLHLSGSGSSSEPNFLYSWTATQGGSILSGANEPNPLIGTPGQYTMVVTNPGNGCTTADNVFVSNNLTSPTSIISSPPLLTCINITATLSGLASLPANNITYQWLTTNGNIQSGQAYATAIVTEAGQYTLVVTNIANGCTHASTVTVGPDNSVPVANAVVSTSLDCTTTQLTINGAGSSFGSNFDLQWSSSTGSGFVSGQNTLTPLVNAPATYTLLITDLHSQCTSSATVVIGQNVQPPPANAGSSATLTCTLPTLTIGDDDVLLAPHLVYYWTSLSGNIIGGVNTPVATVNQPGNYHLLVTNTANGCSSVDSVVVSQNIAKPMASVAPGGELACMTPTLQLNGNGSSTGAAFSYNWTSSTGGGIGAGSTTLLPTVTAAGIYTLVVTNAANGCTASASATVTTNANLPIAFVVPSGILTCTVSQITLAATGSSIGPNFSYNWGTVTGSILSGQSTPVITIGLAATYTLIVTNASNQCSATFAVVVAANLVPPVAEAGPMQTLLCTTPSLQLNGLGSSTGTNFHYSWSGPGLVSGLTTLLPTVNTPGTYQLLVTNTQNGCTTTDEVQIGEDANQPIVQIAAPGTLNCTVTQLMLNATGSSVGNNFAYLWNGPGVVSGGTSLLPQIDAPGNYRLKITNLTNGCVSVDTVAVTEQVTLPPADAGLDNLLSCFHAQLQIGGPANPTGSGYLFTWAGPGIVSGGSSPHPVIDQGGLYKLTVTNTENGCTAVDQTNIATDFVYPQAAAGPGFQLTCTQNTYLLNATGSLGSQFTYSWTTNTGNFISPTNILHPTINGAGQYYLTVANTSNGCTATANVQITKAADVPNSLAATPGVLTCTTLALTLSGNGSSSGQPFAYLWSSPDGGHVVSGGTTLSPVVDQPGTYNLAVTDTTNHCPSNSSVVVTRDTAAPLVNAGQAPTLTCSNPSTSLQATVGSNGAFTYLWTTQSGGHLVGMATTLTPVVDAAGTYTLTITSQQNGCTNTASVLVLANQAPPILMMPLPDTLTCTVDEIHLKANGDTSHVEYTWTTQHGHFVSPPAGLDAHADQPGTYALLVKDLSNGCTKLDSVEVVQDTLKPLARADGNGLLTCAVTSLELNGTGSSQNGNYFYEWTSPDGQILAGANSLTPTVVAGGIYTLVIVNKQNGCTATDQTLIAMDTLAPAVAIEALGLLACAHLQITLYGTALPSGPTLEYAWLTATGHIVSGQATDQIVVDAVGQYTLDVLNTTNGCSSSATTQVSDNIVLPIADAGASFTLTCTMREVTLQGSGSNGPYHYAWTAQSSGSIVSGADTPNPVVSQPGLYQLVVTNDNTGCQQTDQVEIFQEANLPTDFETVIQEPSCKNNDAVITFGEIAGGTGPYLYSIDGGQQFFPSVSFANLRPGSYDLWIQDANGCTLHDSLVVPATPTIAVSLPPEISLDLGDSTQLNALLPVDFPLALLDTVIWQPLDGLIFSGTDLFSLLHPQVRLFHSRQYTVTVSSVDHCVASTRVLIQVDTDPHIYIPNVFSPQYGHQDNNIALIFADDGQIVEISDFQIFDRWGELVFQDQHFPPNDPSHGWNGQHRGKLMAPAVFSYFARILLIDGRTLVYEGDITLVR